VIQCLWEGGLPHPLVGNQVTYKEAELDGAHRVCLLQAVAMCKQTIMDLLTTTVQQWICSSSRQTEDHQAMLSSQPSCSCCISLEETVGIYSRMWMDGIARKYGGKVLTQTEMTNDTPVNNSELAKHMHNLHHGQHDGLIRPEHWCQGSEGACDCTKVPNEVEASNVWTEPPMLWVSPTRGALRTKWKKR
jgi:hypothetical protein